MAEQGAIRPRAPLLGGMARPHASLPSSLPVSLIYKNTTCLYLLVSVKRSDPVFQRNPCAYCFYKSTIRAKRVIQILLASVDMPYLYETGSAALSGIMWHVMHKMADSFSVLVAFGVRQMLGWGQMKSIH